MQLDQIFGCSIKFLSHIDASAIIATPLMKEVIAMTDEKILMKELDEMVLKGHGKELSFQNR